MKEDRHPTDASGRYLRAGDNKARVARGGYMLVTDDEIAWFELGDVLDVGYGGGYVVEIDCLGCTYVVQTNRGRRRVTFKSAKRL